MSRHVHQIPFAAEGAFAWNRNTVHNGQPVKAGDPVNTEAFTLVRLRQMYDARMIVPAPGFAGRAPAYINNGVGKADKLRAEIEREEAEQSSAKGESHAQPRSQAKPAAPRGANAKKFAAAAKPAAAKTVAKPAAKSTPKRAAARSR